MGKDKKNASNQSGGSWDGPTAGSNQLPDGTLGEAVATSGLATLSGSIGQIAPQHPCPSCGYCPCCGRRNAQPWGYPVPQPYYPTYPGVYPVWYDSTSPAVWC